MTVGRAGNGGNGAGPSGMRVAPGASGILAAVAVALAACGGGRSNPRSAPDPVSPPARSAPSPPARAPLPPRPTYTGPADTNVTPGLLDSLWSRQLMVPIEGMARAALSDTYTAPRTGKIHGALDIAAPKSTPVLAPDDLVIGRLYTGPIGGIVIYATDPSGRLVYYFAHLERYRRGLAVGDKVAKGSLIAYVGTTGNASPKAPHLHFQVMRRGAKAWWDGPPVNPYSLFAMDGTRPAPRAKEPPPESNEES